MVYGTLPFWPPSGNHNELEIMVKHRELPFPATAEATSTALAAEMRATGGVGNVTGGGSGVGIGGGGSSLAGGVSDMDMGGEEGEEEEEGVDEGQVEERKDGSGGSINGGDGGGEGGGRRGSGLVGSAPLREHDPMVGYLKVGVRRGGGG